MLDPSKRLSTLIMAAGIAVFLVALVLGERIGDRVLTHGTLDGAVYVPVVTVTPGPVSTGGTYGYGWSHEQVLSAAPDPRFPDPRVPPQPLPTLPPQVVRTPGLTPTPNPNIPIWDQAPFPRLKPTATPEPGATNGG